MKNYQFLFILGSLWEINASLNHDIIGHILVSITFIIAIIYDIFDK